MMCIGEVRIYIIVIFFNFFSSMIRLEQFMSDLPHLKIVEVIVKCCCPFIPNDSQRLSELHCTHLPLHNE